ncbi:MAG TPA: histidine kinase [Vicinamibacteria bacterium]|nr:histidine kinase [Vicinamibacteria bacterium]
MRGGVERRWILSLLWINLAVIVMVPLIQMASNQATEAKDLWTAWGHALVYGNVAGFPASLILPWVLNRAARGRLPLVPVVILGCMAFTALGCLAAQTLLWGMSGAALPSFWAEYFRTLRMTTLFSVAFGLGVFSYASLRERLLQVETRLHEQELAAERTRTLAAEARLRSLEARVHPHFLFNTLNSISSLIKTAPARAEEMVGKLAALLRSSLDNTNRPLIPLRQELAMVDDYIEIERVRFGGKLRGAVDVPLDLREVMVPPLSVQSLVENAVKHGITALRGGGEVRVQGSSENGCLRIEVSDTGPGFDLSAIPADHGLDNLVGRLDALFGPRARLNVRRRAGRCVVEMVLPRS